jgi:aspartate kinase
MASPSNLLEVIELIDSNIKYLIVVSALKGVTNLLIEIADLLRSKKNEIAFRKGMHIIELHKSKWAGYVNNKIFEEISQDLETHLKVCILLKEQSLQARNKLISRGEIYSSILLNELLSKAKIKSKLIKSPNYLHKKVELFQLKKSELLNEFKEIDILISQGFVYSENAKLKIMDRGGSDQTASIFGAELKAKKVIIWTDVSGIYSADPNKFKKAKILSKISYIQLVELSKFGAKVLHINSIKPAIEENIPVLIRNTFRKDQKGTEIVKSVNKEEYSISYSPYIRVVFQEDELLSKLKLILALSKYNKNNLELISSNNDLNLFIIDNELNRAMLEREPEKYIILLIIGNVNQNKLKFENAHYQITDKKNLIKKVFIKGDISQKEVEKFHNNLIK